MERLHKVTSVCVFIACVCCIWNTAMAQNACSLKVRVLSPKGQRVPSLVSVRDHDGRVVEKEHKRQDVQFCDLGFLPVTVTIGTGAGCQQAIFKDVFVTTNDTYLLNATVDIDNCSPEMGSPIGRVCQVMLRVRDSHGKYVSGPRVSISNPETYVANADRFGRLLLAGKIGVPVPGSVEAPGYKKKEFSFTCSGYDPQEEVVRLEKQQDSNSHK